MTASELKFDFQRQFCNFHELHKNIADIDTILVQMIASHLYYTYAKAQVNPFSNL